MEAYQLRKLISLVKHAATHVPHCRYLFRSHGVEADDIRKLGDLSRIPITGKQQLREQFRSIPGEMINRDQLIEHKTSGSTGIPMHILRSPAEERKLNMFNWRMHWIIEYQVIQEELDSFQLLTVPLSPLDTGEEARFRGALLDKLGAGTKLQIEWTDSIAREESGKLHFCRSLKG